MRKISVPVLIVLIAVASFVGVALAATVYLTINSTGHVNHVDTPTAITSSPSSIDWGTFNAGQTVTKTVVLTNNGEAASSALSMSAGALPTGASLSWDGGGKTIAGGASLTVTFTLVTLQTTPTADINCPITIGGS